MAHVRSEVGALVAGGASLVSGLALHSIWVWRHRQKSRRLPFYVVTDLHRTYSRIKTRRPPKIEHARHATRNTEASSTRRLERSTRVRYLFPNSRTREGCRRALLREKLKCVLRSLGASCTHACCRGSSMPVQAVPTPLPAVPVSPARSPSRSPSRARFALACSAAHV